jgi:N-acetylmuramoyl-L-alanine amidase
VQYPAPGALITARDSTFLLGSTGHGDAQLTVNGAPVRVHPNGAWLAWVAMPPRDASRFEVVATLAGGPVQRVSVPVRRPAPRRALGPTELVDSTSVVPRPGLALRADEPVRVAARVAPGARVSLVPASTPDTVLPLLVDGEQAVRELPARLLRGGASLLVARGGDSVRLAVPAVGDGDALPLVRVGRVSADTDAVVVARPVAGGTYKWFLLPGTVLRASGRQGDALRVRLDRQLDVWIDSAQATPLPEGTPEPRRVIGNARVVPADDWVDVVLPVSAHPAWRVEAEGTSLRLTLHGATADADVIWFTRADAYVRDVTWTNDASDRAVVTVSLAAPAFGWLVLWRGDALVLRVRRPPRVDAASPLRGLRIAVDPGHPPAGSTGPTGLYEGDATLAVGMVVRDLLRERGAEPVLTRTTPDAVPLADRPVLARRVNAHAFVSIHLNALPDGANPFAARGSGTYFFHAPSASLARAIQARLVARLGLADNGTWYDNLAVVRPSWMPSVLVEGAYLIVPEQEAALRTPAFRRAYALAIVEGLEAWFAALASPAVPSPPR